MSILGLSFLVAPNLSLKVLYFVFILIDGLLCVFERGSELLFVSE